MADRSLEIHAINQALNAGATDVWLDGVRVRLNLDALRMRKRELMSESEDVDSLSRRRPVTSRIILSSF